MSDPETPEPIPQSQREPGGDPVVEPPDDAEGDDAPAPEPWTPERAREWNAYYDVYVMLGVLLLVFIASSNKITGSAVWSRLQVGRVIAATGAPVTTDLFSFTQTGKPWVNVPWLFDLGHALAYRLAADMTPAIPQDPAASAARADQVGAGTLVALGAIARLLTAFVLLQVRRAGPGLWWTAVCTMLALGAGIGPTLAALPAGVVLGGIATPGQVMPGTWGLLFFAVEVWLLHRAVNAGHDRSAFALVPLFLLWANVDESFLAGLLVFAAVAAGRVRPSKGEEPGGVGTGKALGVLAASAAACLVNPSHVMVYVAALDPLFKLFRPSTDVPTLDQLSYFGQGIRTSTVIGPFWPRLLAYYLALVAIGYGSFYLNRRRFSLSRFLAFTTVVLLWGVWIRFAPEFAVVLGLTLALNGQEWYQQTYGTQGRIGIGWSLFSVGGRLVTLTAIFAALVMALTGYGKPLGESQFGFGYDPDEFAFEAADFLKTAPIKGEVLNTTMSQGDAILWRAYPEHKSYIDSRQHLFPPDVLNRVQEVRGALSDDDPEHWKPLLDEYKVSTVMLQASTSTKTLRVLSLSNGWIPFYDDGNTVLYGRTDADAADVAFFKANRLDPDEMAYRRSKPTPPAERPPSPVTWMDSLFQTRSQTRPQPHTEAARRWLLGPAAGATDGAAAPLPTPARCLMAVREARAALALKPDDPQAFRVLATAYRDLMIQEAALLAGIELKPENATLVRQISPRPDLLMTRFRQRVTSLNYAVQTTPPPSSPEARRELQGLNLELFQLFAAVNFVDLARDRLEAVLQGSAPADFGVEFRTQLTQTLAQLNEQTKQVQNQLNDVAVEQQAGPVQLASLAISNGALGLALHDLEEAERTGTNPAQVKPQLLDLYCDTGQPDKALEMLSSGTVNDPSLGTEPGLAATRQARAYLLLGNSEYAATLWEKNAIPDLRRDRSVRALAEVQDLIRGEPKASTSKVLDLPDKIALQAAWEFDAGICRLEAGIPELAADHFTKALTLAPGFNLRPIAAYYLEQMGKPVPKPPEDSQSQPPTAKAVETKDKAGPKPAEAGKDQKEKP